MNIHANARLTHVRREELAPGCSRRAPKGRGRSLRRIAPNRLWVAAPPRKWRMTLRQIFSTQAFPSRAQGKRATGLSPGVPYRFAPMPLPTRQSRQ